MKLGEDVLLEIVDILRDGIANGKDISDMLRDMDLEIGPDQKLNLSGKYLADRARAV